MVNKIYSPNLQYLKGKTVRIQLMTVVADYITVPPDIIKDHGYLIVEIDVMYINNISFVVRKSQKI